jgi:hypothetical protein
LLIGIVATAKVIIYFGKRSGFDIKIKPDMRSGFIKRYERMD